MFLAALNVACQIDTFMCVGPVRMMLDAGYGCLRVLYGNCNVQWCV